MPSQVPSPAPITAFVPSAASASTLQAPVGQPQLKISGPVGRVQINLTQGGTDLQGQDQEGPDVTPKKHRQRVELHVLKFNSLDPRGKKGDTAEVTDSDGKSDSGAPAHRLGDGKIGDLSVRDVIKRVTGTRTTLRVDWVWHRFASV